MSEEDLATLALAGPALAEPAAADERADERAETRAETSDETLADDLARESDYWRRELAGAPSGLELPLDRLRPPAASGVVATSARCLAPAAAARLRQAARREGVALDAFLLAAFAALLARYSGAEDLLIGAGVATGAGRAIVLPLRLAWGGDPPFRRFLGAAVDAWRGALAHAPAARDGGWPAGVDVPPLQALFAGLAARQAVDGRGEGAPPADLALSVREVEVEDGGGEPALALALTYAVDLFDATTAARLLAHYAALARAAAASPELPLSRLPFLSAAERHQLFVEWNDTESAFPRRSLHRLFEEQAAARPEAVAIVWDGGVLTYAELDRRAGRVARRLREMGIGQEARIALYMERSAELVTAVLGILKAGGVYLPIDVSYPRERLALLLADAAPAAVAGSRRSLASLPAELPRLAMEDLAAAPDLAGPAFGESAEVPPAGLAYVLYTSGSTGKPNGVEVTHQAVVRLVRESGYIDFGPRDTFLHVAHMSFDASTLELWWPLLNGGRLALAPPGRFALDDLYAQVERHAVTAAILTTGLFHVAVEEGLQGLRGLRYLIVGGDAMSRDHAERALAALPGVEIVNAYGPTENAVIASTRRLRAGLGEGAVTIGRPIPTCRVYVLDDRLEPVPTGAAGELYLAGVGVARGYLDRRELTAERMLPDPFSAEPGGRLYKTGDLGRWRPDGTLGFLGRRDFQVKVRGFRIEPGEIETALLRHPRVREAVVVGLAEGGRDHRVVAYYVAEPGVTRQELRAFLRARLPEHMVPAAFVPLATLPLTPIGKLDRRALPPPEELPGGDEAAAHAAARDLIDPLDPTPEILAGLWAEVLDADPDRAASSGGAGAAGRPIGLDDSFFDLGGHSLSAIRLLSRLRQTLGVELGVQTLFAFPTLAALSRVVASARREEEEGPLPPLVPVPRRGLLPLSSAQRRLWFLDRLAPGSPLYNVPAAWRLAGPLKPAALAAALSEVARRHEVLRARFVEVGGEPRQEIAPPAPVPLPEIDLSGLESARRESELSRLYSEESGRPFDLARGPLLRAALVRLSENARAEHAGLSNDARAEHAGQSDDAHAEHAGWSNDARAEHALWVTVHHAVYDGWSETILLRELAALYAAAVEGRPSPLRELPVQYADYAAWQAAWPPEALARQQDYWRRQLAGAPGVIELPADRPRPAVQTFRGASRFLRLTAGESAALRQAARREETTLYMLLLAGFAALLGRLTGQQDLLVGTPVADRTRPELEGLIGFFVNTLALRADLAGDPPFRRLLAAVRETALGAFAHQDLPFETLVEELRPERDLSRNPLVQVLLSFQGASGAAAGGGAGLRVERLPTPERATAKFDLLLSILELAEGGATRAASADRGGERPAPAGPGGEKPAPPAPDADDRVLALMLEYAADLFTATTAARLLAGYATLVSGAAAVPETPLSALPLLAEAERHQLVAEWNDTASAYPREPVHRLFEEQAAARPDAVAVTWDGGDLGGALTYGELDRRAALVARRLRRLGAGLESRVAVCASRSPEMVVAILGALKAGAAYLPLDPAYPRERLALLLADAAPAALVAPRRLLAAFPGVPGVPGAMPRLAIEDAFADAGDLDVADPMPLSADVPPAALAYVLYTSGSTGAPKGVEVSHRSVVRLVREASYAAFGPAEVYLQLVPMSFDVATFELWGPLLHGGRLALLPPGPYTLADLYAAVERHGVTTLWLTSGVFHLAAEGAPEDLAPLRGLKQLLAGGDVLSRSHVERALAALPGVEIVDGYGPTENTTFSTTQRLRGGLPAGEPSVPIGRPVSASRAYVLDRAMRPLPVGCVGELYVGGDGVARGYLGRPELTAERFLPDPFSADPPGSRGRLDDSPGARSRPDTSLGARGLLDDSLGARSRPDDSPGARGLPDDSLGARLYRTGDLARWRPDGTLDFLGRRDFQVKVRGFRVEPGEVEEALVRLPGVREAVVTTADEAGGGHRLVAYYVALGGGEPTPYDRHAGMPAPYDRRGGEPTPDDLRPGGPAQDDRRAGVPTPDDLRAGLRGRLPEHMVPSVFVRLPALPLNANGKVDRRALPPPDAAGGGEGTAAGVVAPRAPANPIEEVIAGIWAEVLGVSRALSVEESFFHLGGHSLLALRMLSRLREALGADLSVQQVFEAPTIAGLAAAVAEAAAGATDRPALPPLAPRAAAGNSETALAPLSYAQQRLWFLDRLAPGSTAYNVPATYALAGPLAPAALEAALSAVARRHAVLRSRFVERDGEPWQEIEPPRPIPLPIIDLSALSALAHERRPERQSERQPERQSERQSERQPERQPELQPQRQSERQTLELSRLRGEEAARPFDLARGPLVRAALVRLGGAGEPDHALLLDVHHAVYDAWSEGVLLRELAALYAAALAGLPSPLPAPRLQYADFAAWQRAWPPEVLGRQLNYWRGELAGAPQALALATDRPRPAVASFRGAGRRLLLPEEALAALRQTARREGATLYMLLLAAFAATLARHGAQEDLLVGSPVANRARPELEGLIGFFVNTLALRARLAGDPPFRRLLASLRETALAAFAHQDLPFEALVEELRPERDLSRSPLVQAMLSLGAAGRPERTLAGGLHLARLATGERTTAKLDLSLAATELAGDVAPGLPGHGGDAGPRGLLLELEYAADLFHPTTAARLLSHFAALLAGAAAEPDLPLSLLPLLSAAERHQATAEWNDTAAERERHTVHGLFAAQAAARPDAVALSWDGGGSGEAGAIGDIGEIGDIGAMSYGELDRRAGAIARRLRRLGVRPDDPVGLLTERSPEMVAALLGILKAGGGYLPLDPAYPRERLELLLADAAPAAVVGSRRVIQTALGSERRVMQTALGHERGIIQAELGSELLRQTALGHERRVIQAELGSERQVIQTALGHERKVTQAELGSELLGQAALVPELLGPAALGPGCGASMPEPLPTLALDELESSEPSASPDDDALSSGDVSPDGLAYVLYTSGSTGRPKGVEVVHRGIVRLVRDAGYAAFGPGETLLQLSPMSFDAATIEIWGALLNGGRLAILRPGPFGLRDVYDAVAHHGVTTLFLTTGLFHLAVDEGMEDQPDLAGLRQLLTGGDVMSREHLLRALAALPGVEIVHCYGPTENTTNSTAYRVRAGLEEGSVTIGRPLRRSAAYVLDAALAPLPVGVPGELYVGGDGLARGYLGLPARTAESFVPDPFGRSDGSLGARGGPDGSLGARGRSDGSLGARGRSGGSLGARGRSGGSLGARLYRTGDLARWRTDGTLEFLGRRDLQVKVRGFRIEPGEVEAALLRHPAVREAVVAALPNPAGGHRLVAYYALAADREASAGDLRAHLRERLPEHMVPAAFVRLPALPLTPHGKVDRRALPAPEEMAEAADRAAASPEHPPANPVEEMIAGIWADLLGLDRPVSPGEDFFQLGGHSLLATRLLSRLRQAFGVELPVQRVFASPTVAGLAAAIAAVGQTGEGALPPITPLPRRGPLPLSYPQQRLWFMDRLAPRSPTYNIPSGYLLRGPLAPAALAAALAGVVARHEVLRSRIVSRHGEPAQEVLPPPPASPLPLADLAALPAARRAPELAALALHEARRGFDLERGPMVRGTLVRLAGEEHAFLLTLHHVAADGWSEGILRRELSALYAAALAGRPSPLPPLALQYGDFAAWQRAWPAEALAAQLAFWTERLAGTPALELPGDRPRPAVATFRGDTQALALPPDLAAALRRLARGHQATVFMVLLAAWHALLARHSGQDDFAVGTPVANRTRPELEPLVGVFLNMLALRSDGTGDPSFAGLLSRARRTALAAYDHADVPFERIVDEVNPARDRGRQPLVQTMAALNSTPGVALALPGIAAAPLALSARVSRFDLSVGLVDRGAELVGGLEYSADLFDRATMARLAGHLVQLLAAAAADPSRRIAEIDLLSPAERQQVAIEWNDTAADLAGNLGAGDEPRLHRSIERQAARTPGETAVVGEDGSLTYGELDGRANRLARRLRALGVRVDEPVAICAERSPALLVGLLAILKAGGAYLPLDPSYPRERLAFMIEDGLAGLAAPVLLAPAAQWPLLEGPAAAAGARLVDLDAAMAEGEADAAPLESGAGPDDLAYVIYTSGSTGRPKGVMNTHRGIVNRILWMQRAYRLTPDDRVLQKTPLSFDVSVWELFWPLAVGARLVLARPGGQRDPAYLARRIEEQGVTTLHFVPSMLRVFLEQADRGRCRSLRRVMASGEALPAELARRFHEVGLGDSGTAELHNLYGPTEAAVDVTAHACRPGEAGRSVPIGRPISNLGIWLLDRELRPVPLGVPGELYIGGVGLARGYLRRPALTAEHFVPHPLGSLGARLYRTGDLARFVPDGEIEFLGRTDDQVKLRGFRVEPGEIEAALARLPAVGEAAVVVREERPGDVRLAAYVVPASFLAPEESELRDGLRRLLPEHMVPADFFVVDALPLTPSGKLDRGALRARQDLRPARELEPAAEPESELEALLVGIWQDLLGRAPIGIYDNLFDLGAHSLLSLQFTARVQEALDLEIPLHLLFESPTVRQLAMVIEDALIEQVESLTDEEAELQLG